MHRSAARFFCISLLLAVRAWAGDVPPDPARVATVELEARLARRPAIYLVLDPPQKLLEIKARGLVLDAVRLEGIEVVSQQPLLGARAPQPPSLPGIWTVVTGPGDTDREIIAPDSLRPYSDDDEEEEPPTPSASDTPAATPTPIPEPPVSYRARLDNGWDLWITGELPPQHFWGRFWAAVRDGWRRLRGRGDNAVPAITLAMRASDAQRLHHLLRKGTALLVAAGSP
jgi:hypothetical protein